MSPEEDQIWESIQQRNVQAFEDYYKGHYKLFFLTACKYVGDTALAQEVVNDVFVRLWQEADRITIQTSLKSYVYRSVVNRCLNELEKNKRDQQHRRELGRQTEPGTEPRQLEMVELEIRIYQAIDQLPEQCRKVFRMSRFEELRHREIADQLGISVKTVKNHITRALQQINRVMDEWNSNLLWAVALKISFLSLSLGLRAVLTVI